MANGNPYVQGYYGGTPVGMQPYSPGQQYTQFMYTPQDVYQMELRKRLIGEFQGQREQDLSRGRARGMELFGQGALGRLEDYKPQQFEDLLGRRKAALGGYTGEQYQALRERGLQGLNRQSQGSLQQLQGIQARTGVRGGTAAAQQMALLQNKDKAAADVYRDLVIGDVQERNRALGAYEGTLSGMRQAEYGRQQYNQQQAARELQGRLALEFGYGQLGAADRAAAQRQIAGQSQLNAAYASQPGGK